RSEKMFGGEDEDGDFLSPTGGAKLASLFGLDQDPGQANESFQYTAPKQPRKSSTPAPVAPRPAPPAAAPAVLFATAVQTFRYINGQYVKQGKLGAAVLGNHAAKEYKLLLYLNQQKQVTSARIHLGFVFTLQPNSYYTFYDDHMQNWSVTFESEKSSSDFCREVCLAKANSAAPLDAALVQDLRVGEGQAVEPGDFLEVSYTGWLLHNHVIGPVFDSNQSKDKLLRFKVGSGRVIRGWEEGMVGMKKSGLRLIVVPPQLAYGAKGVPNRIPANSTLIFEVELHRVKFCRDGGSDPSSSREPTAPSPAPSAASVEAVAADLPVLTSTPGPLVLGEPTLRAKSNSLSEQLATFFVVPQNPDVTKANLISRMAKMGQPMLPFLKGGSSQPESSDSELEPPAASCFLLQPPAAPCSPLQPPASSCSPLLPPAAPCSPLQAPAASCCQGLVSSERLQAEVWKRASRLSSGSVSQPYAYTHPPVAPAALQPAGPVCPTQPGPYLGSADVTSFLMTEARQQNTEIRLSIGKVADKVDQLTSKIDGLQKQASLSVGVSSMPMETSVILHNIQRMVQENECLKKEVFDKSARIEEQNRKISELIDQNQRYLEQSNLLLEKRNDSFKMSNEQSQAKLLQAEQEKVRLTEDLALSTSRQSQLQLEASSHQQKSLELQSKLSSLLQSSDDQSQRIAGLEAQLGELKEAADTARTQHRSEKQRRKQLELRLSSLEEELQDLKTEKEGLGRTLLERKKKWQAELQRRDEEMEELRRSSQQEQEKLWAQLRKARSSTEHSVSDQVCQMQAELEEEWKERCRQALASAKEHHGAELAELLEQRDLLQEQLGELQQKLSDLEQQGASEKARLEQRVCELERSLEEQQPSADVPAEVKRVMNGVFHSLRGEFEVGESYNGQAVLSTIVSTIKNVTLQLLSGTDAASLKLSKDREEEEKQDKRDGREQPGDGSPGRPASPPSSQ
uniref:peptidylprolyl isomerase n=1 Tax=Tetraodon nigroviridis TaxID=99883 RepID=H3CCZ0_TETNG